MIVTEHPTFLIINSTKTKVNAKQKETSFKGLPGNVMLLFLFHSRR